MRGFGPIVKHVSEVRVTSVAQNLDSSHAIAIVDLGSDLPFGYRRPEAWPSVPESNFVSELNKS